MSIYKVTTRWLVKIQPSQPLIAKVDKEFIMHLYAAIASRQVKLGSLYQCVEWGAELINHSKAKIIKIAKVRPEDKDAPIIMEQTKNVIFWVANGRKINTRMLKVASKNA